MAAKRVATGLALGILLAAPGCQGIFGLGEYRFEEGSGGAAAGPTSGGGPGSTGGAPPDCVCPGEAWRPVDLVASGPVASTDLPTVCPDSSAPLNLYGGAPAEVLCDACTCAAEGCDAPALHCFTDATCGGGEKQFGAFSGCIDLGMGARSCRLSADPVASCTPGGGAPSAPPAFEEAWSFCAGEACPSEGCVEAAVACVVTEGVGPPCPADFPERLELHAGADDGCPACSCEGSCGGAPYQVTDNVFVCLDDVAKAVGSTSCANVQTDLGSLARGWAQRRGGFGPACTPNLPEPHAGSFTPTGPHTICCREPLE